MKIININKIIILINKYKPPRYNIITYSYKQQVFIISKTSAKNPFRYRVR